jgi:tRNA(Ile)-lysidine synthase
MPAYRRRGRGWHVRPLLDFTREALTAYACAQGLAWVEDPSNGDARLARAWLRETVVPVLRRRWPGVAGSVGRSARLCAASDALDGALACLDLGIGEAGPGGPDADAGAAEGPRLAVARLLPLSDVRRLNALRFWIRAAGHPAPPERRLRQAVADLLAGDPSGEGVARWDRTELRRYRDHLYLLPPLPTAGGADRRVDPRRSIALPPGLGDLALEVADGRVPRALRLAAGALAGRRVTVGFRAGGERLRLPGRDGTRRLKRLLQEWGVVPWMRHRLPILRVDGEIAAVADLAVAAPFQAAAGEPALVVRWRRHPSVF